MIQEIEVGHILTGETARGIMNSESDGMSEWADITKTRWFNKKKYSTLYSVIAKPDAETTESFMIRGWVGNGDMVIMRIR